MRNHVGPCPKIMTDGGLCCHDVQHCGGCQSYAARDRKWAYDRDRMARHYYPPRRQRSGPGDLTDAMMGAMDDLMVGIMNAGGYGSLT